MNTDNDNDAVNAGITVGASVEVGEGMITKSSLVPDVVYVDERRLAEAIIAAQFMDPLTNQLVVPTAELLRLYQLVKADPQLVLEPAGGASRVEFDNVFAALKTAHRVLDRKHATKWAARKTRLLLHALATIPMFSKYQMEIAPNISQDEVDHYNKELARQALIDAAADTKGKVIN